MIHAFALNDAITVACRWLAAVWLHDKRHPSLSDSLFHPAAAAPTRPPSCALAANRVAGTALALARFAQITAILAAVAIARVDSSVARRFGDTTAGVRGQGVDQIIKAAS